jgi:hypothetical protein
MRKNKFYYRLVLNTGAEFIMTLIVNIVEYV